MSIDRVDIQRSGCPPMQPARMLGGQGMRVLPGLLVLLLGGCVGAESGGPWIHWVCDSEVELLWRHVNGEPDWVNLRLDGAEHIYHLTEQVGGSGVIYSDGELVFQTKGEQGLLYWAETDEMIGRSCQQPVK